MKRTKEISQKKALFIEELERPALATTLDWTDKKVTTMALGEEALKAG